MNAELPMNGALTFLNSARLPLGPNCEYEMRNIYNHSMLADQVLLMLNKPNPKFCYTVITSN